MARAAFWAILLFAAAIRLALFSGYGLGDDPGYFHCYHDILRTGQWNPERAYDWRFAFWIPVVGAMRLFGVSEWSFVAFVFAASLVNVVLVWALARQEWPERWASLVAMALIAVFPLEVLSSTLFVIDVPLAMWAFAALWLYRQACLARWGPVGVAATTAAGVLLFLAYSTKQWGVLVGTIFAGEALRGLRSTWRHSALCAGTFLLLVATYHGWQWWRFGDPIRDFHVVRRVAIFLPHSWDIVTDYSRMLLLRNELGSWFGGWYPHALLALGVVFMGKLREAGAWPGYFLVLLACLSAMPSHREDGRWVLLVPHIFRYLCFLSIPLCLALAAYARLLIHRRPVLGSSFLAALVVVSVLQAETLTAPTRDAFGEQRRVNALLMASFPNERFVSDWDFLHRLVNFQLGGSLVRVERIRSEDPEGQARELVGVRDGVVISGGARLPWYGCRRCAVTLERFSPGPSWRLVTAIEGPRTVYRREPLRIWRVSGADNRVSALLAGTPGEGTSRLDTLRSLFEAQDWPAVDVHAAGRRRAHSFLALTLYRLRRVDEAAAEAASYRMRYGVDDAAIELEFRHAVAGRAIDPARARGLFEALAARRPASYWGREANQLAAELPAS